MSEELTASVAIGLVWRLQELEDRLEFMERILGYHIGATLPPDQTAEHDRRLN